MEQEHKKNQLTHAEQELLYDKMWFERFEELKNYKLFYGHCNVPRQENHPTNKLSNPRLAFWVLKQRQLKRLGRLPDERVQNLESIGFEWNPFKNQWEKHYEDLVKYKLKFGNCNVPRIYPENQTLSKWVLHMRTYKYRLSKERIQKLDKLGFVWRLAPNRPLNTLYYFKKKLEKL